MTNLVRLHFDVVCYVHEELADDLGKDLATFLEESWFNGEDVFEVEFKDYSVINQVTISNEIP